LLNFSFVAWLESELVKNPRAERNNENQPAMLQPLKDFGTVPVPKVARTNSCP
jgi:hypothetical protein